MSFYYWGPPYTRFTDSYIINDDWCSRWHHLFKKWKYLWTEWLTTVDHKKIGIMYIISAVLMFFRGGMDGLLMKAQTSQPEMEFLNSQHYNEIFTTHGVIMILFMAMPFLIGLMNVVIPLQIGARDVAFPQLNALSFWLFFSGAMLFNISFVIGDRLMQDGLLTSLLQARNSVRESEITIMQSLCRLPVSVL